MYKIQLMLPDNGWSKMPEQSNWLPIYLSSGQKTHLLFNSVQILGGHHAEISPEQEHLEGVELLYLVR